MTTSKNSIMNTYGRLPVTFTRGDGVYLYDDQDKQYLDGISGIGVNALGHAHPAVSKTIAEQASQLIHTSNLYGIGKQTALADTLCRLSGMDNVFFSNSGAEANEAAIKIARLYGHQKGVEQPTIIVMDNAFHGRTMATLTASGNRKIQAGFEPLVSGFTRAPFGDFEALETIAKNNSNVVAVLLEPIQGEGGLHVLPEGYLKQLRTLCDNQEWLLMLDEVQTGNARTGKYFAFQHDGIVPDIVTPAKGLGNGMPIGACLAAGQAASVFVPGNHGSTFGGNPLACATASTVIETIEQQKLCDNADQQGQYLRDQLAQRLAGVSTVKDIRGQGLMIGIEMDQDVTALVGQALNTGLLINVTHQSVVRLLPPLIINRSQCDELLDVLCPLITNIA